MNTITDNYPKIPDYSVLFKALKEQLSIKQKDYDQRQQQLQLFSEVLENKQQDIQANEEKVKDLKVTKAFQNYFGDNQYLGKNNTKYVHIERLKSNIRPKTI